MVSHLSSLTYIDTPQNHPVFFSAKKNPHMRIYKSHSGIGDINVQKYESHAFKKCQVLFDQQPSDGTDRNDSSNDTRNLPIARIAKLLLCRLYFLF